LETTKFIVEAYMKKIGNLEMNLMIMRKGLKQEQQYDACTPTSQDDKTPKLVETHM
jgi:hypothetical protein